MPSLLAWRLAYARRASRIRAVTNGPALTDETRRKQFARLEIRRDSARRAKNNEQLREMRLVLITASSPFCRPASRFGPFRFTIEEPARREKEPTIHGDISTFRARNGTRPARPAELQSHRIGIFI